MHKLIQLAICASILIVVVHCDTESLSQVEPEPSPVTSVIEPPNSSWEEEEELYGGDQETTRARRKRRCGDIRCAKRSGCLKKCMYQCNEPAQDECTGAGNNRNYGVGHLCTHRCNCAPELTCDVDGKGYRRCRERTEAEKVETIYPNESESGESIKCGSRYCHSGNQCEESCQYQCADEEPAQDECTGDGQNHDYPVGHRCWNHCNCAAHLRCDASKKLDGTRVCRERTDAEMVPEKVPKYPK